MSIEVSNLYKSFGSFTAVDDVSMKVEEGSLTALLGPSGSGKTTVLRMIAGLEIPDGGRILINGQDVSNLTAQKRNVGFVFQQYALFKHMRVQDNIAFSLKVRGWKKDAIRDRVSELLGLLRLEGLERRYPDQISGGQRQRVALARALASHPQVLLLDEPFSALDARVRDELREWLRSLHEQLHVTSVFVTHDQVEAMELADRIVIMGEGRVRQAGTPEEIVREPNSSFVMNFLGRANALAGHAEHGVAHIEGLQLPYPAANGASIPVVGYFRPQQVKLSPVPSPGALRVEVHRAVTTGLSLKVHLCLADGGAPITVEIAADQREDLPLAPGSVLYATPLDVRVYASADAAGIPAAGEGG